MAEQFKIVRAERKQARLRLALTAASNGGKTWSAILVALGIVKALIEAKVLLGPVEGKIGMIDTERKSSALYSHLAPFDVVHLDPPYSAARYAGALETLEGAGYPVIIVDQISHAWSGPGGMLELLNRKAKDHYGNTFQAWGDVTPEQDGFIDRLLASPAHLIVTMRQKTEWVLEDRPDRNGVMKKSPRRVGMKPVQRDGVEYDFTTLLGLDTDTHVAKPLKNRCPVFKDGVGVLLTEEIGAMLAEWMLGGAPMAAEETVLPSPEARATGIVVAAEGYLPQCANLPDLARRFGVAYSELKAAREGVAREVMLALVERLTQAKDKSKAVLAGDNHVARDLAPDDLVVAGRAVPGRESGHGIVGLDESAPFE